MTLCFSIRLQALTQACGFGEYCVVNPILKGQSEICIRRYASSWILKYLDLKSALCFPESRSSSQIPETAECTPASFVAFSMKCLSLSFRRPVILRLLAMVRMGIY
jgi:hypothetical protein